MQSPGLVKALTALAILAGALMLSPGALSAGHADSLRIAYFQQWPAPVQFAQAKKTLDGVLDTEVEWVAFRSGHEMAQALASGDVHIAYSLGHVPFTVALSSGAPLSMVGIAVSYPGDDNCLVGEGTRIDRNNASQLAGKSVAVRPGSVSHFRMQKMLEKLGVDPGSVRILPVSDGAAAVAALRQGDAVMACAYGKALADLSAYGKPLLDAAELDSMGLKLFDVIAVENGFLKEHAAVVQSFMEVVAAANDQWARSPDSMLRMIAKAAYMDRKSARVALDGFQFPTPAEQKSAAWMGDHVVSYTADIAAFFAGRGQLANTLADYSPAVTTDFLR